MARPFSGRQSAFSLRVVVLSIFAASVLALPLAAFAQDPYGRNAVSNNNQYPVSRGSVYPSNSGPGYSAPNAIPEGTRFIAVLDDKLETQKIQQGKESSS